MTHESSRTVRAEEPRLFMKMLRNHFADSRESAFYGALSGFGGEEVVGKLTKRNALSASLWASQRQTCYRFGWINAVFNNKCLYGDDPELCKKPQHALSSVFS